MTVTTSAQGMFNGKTAEQWRAEAAAANDRRNESFERCDTDGFVSQWAHQMDEHRYHLNAELAEQNGTTEVGALFDLDGNLLHARHGWGQYGEYWMLLDIDGDNAGYFNPSQARNDARRVAANARKGFYVGTVRVEATTRLVGGGNGLAGAVTSYPSIVPVSEEIDPANAEVIDNGR